MQSVLCFLTEILIPKQSQRYKLKNISSMLIQFKYITSASFNVCGKNIKYNNK